MAWAVPMRIARRLLAVCVIGLLDSAPIPCAADIVPGVDNAVERGVEYLNEHIPQNPASGEAVLGALALIKAGEPAENPAIQAVLRQIEKRCLRTEYNPHQHHYYVAGLEMMLLEAIDAERYRSEMKKILAYILKGQLAFGAWYYPNQNGNGDTSITQYAALGLWSAERAGLDVPRSAWDRMAVWHLKTQLKNGSFSYHPGEPQHSVPGAAVTLGGAANVLLARLYLFGDGAKEEPTEHSGPPKKRFGILEAVELDEPADKNNSARNDADYRPQSTTTFIDRSVVAARNWSAVNFRLPPPGTYKMYYLYALERMAALGTMESLGPHDWYREGAQFLVKNQSADGTWTLANRDGTVGAAFGILFLTRSTAQMLGRSHGVPELGAGMLAGGRGLPTDLGKAKVVNGKVEEHGESGPLDELLARLESARIGDIPATQTAILDAVRFGDREKLLEQRDRIRRLVAHPRAEVRRTAFWVLGRAGDLTDIPRLIKGLADADLDVAIEAHNALCVLSRRPLGFGIPADPLAKLDANAEEQAHQEAIADWRERAIEVWSDWYAQVAPYKERGGLGLFH